ncbi:MAG: ATPase [Thermoanaerobaculia bacterium]|nr:ATPase [Thermoanaerobaculia bacterium]
MRAIPKTLLLTLLGLAATPSGAAVVEAAPSSFVLEVTAKVAPPPSAVWTALGEVGRWWSPEHTWSGDARHLSLALEAGACFCERWEGGSVEHARVIHASRDKLLALGGALGPLQAMAVTGVLSFQIERGEDGTRILATHRVSGDPSHGLDNIAPLADAMLVETMTRLKKYLETGKPQ